MALAGSGGSALVPKGHPLHERSASSPAPFANRTTSPHLLLHSRARLQTAATTSMMGQSLGQAGAAMAKVGAAADPRKVQHTMAQFRWVGVGVGGRTRVRAVEGIACGAAAGSARWGWTPAAPPPPRLIPSGPPPPLRPLPCSSRENAKMEMAGEMMDGYVCFWFLLVRSVWRQRCLRRVPAPSHAAPRSLAPSPRLIKPYLPPCQSSLVSTATPVVAAAGASLPWATFPRASLPPDPACLQRVGGCSGWGWRGGRNGGGCGAGAGPWELCCCLSRGGGGGGCAQAGGGGRIQGSKCPGGKSKMGVLCGCERQARAVGGRAAGCGGRRMTREKHANGTGTSQAWGGGMQS